MEILIWNSVCVGHDSPLGGNRELLIANSEKSELSDQNKIYTWKFNT